MGKGASYVVRAVLKAVDGASDIASGCWSSEERASGWKLPRDAEDAYALHKGDEVLESDIRLTACVGLHPRNVDLGET